MAELPAPRATDDETAPGAAGTAGVVVHVVNELPSEEVGPLKLVRHRGTTTARGGNVIVYTTTYDELCTEPCGVPIDVTERPILFFVRDGNAVTDGFRLDDDEPEVTLSVRPVRRSMVLGGGALLSVLLVPVGVPLLILGRGRVFYGAGAPSPTQELRRVKQARP